MIEEEEEDKPVEMSNTRESGDNDVIPSLLPPKTPRKKKRTSQSAPSNVEETDNENSQTRNTPPKKAGKKIQHPRRHYSALLQTKWNKEI